MYTHLCQFSVPEGDVTLAIVDNGSDRCNRCNLKHTVAFLALSDSPQLCVVL